MYINSEPTGSWAEIYMYDCHSGTNQQFYWGQLFHHGKTISSPARVFFKPVQALGVEGLWI